MDDHWYPSDLKLQAKVDEYLEWQHVNTRLFCAMFFQHKVISWSSCQYISNLEIISLFLVLQTDAAQDTSQRKSSQEIPGWNGKLLARD